MCSEICPSCFSSTGPIATGSLRRRLILKLSQKDALKAIIQQKPYQFRSGFKTNEDDVAPASTSVFLSRRLGQRGPEKEDSHLSFSNKDHCASLHEGSLPGDCHQGRTGLSDENPRTSNPDMVSKPKSSAPPAEPKGQVAQQPQLLLLQRTKGPHPLATAPPHSLPSLMSLLDELMKATVIPALPGPSSGAAANQGVDPALPGTPSLLDDVLVATDILASPGLSPGAALVAMQQPALARTPSLLEEILAATGIRATPGPSLEASADERAHLTLPGSPSLQDELLAALGILASPGPFQGSNPVIAGAHPVFFRSPSLQEEILADMATQDMPWSSPGAPAGDEGLEAILEAPLSEDNYQALIDMLPGSPGPRA
ncbi:hypothetical protein CapIbe_018522 [Capra ibex]